MATNIPTVPNYTGEIALRTDPVNFPQNAEDQYIYLAQYSVDVNAMVNATNIVSGEVEVFASSAANSASASEASAERAKSTSNDAGKWSLLTGSVAPPFSCNDDLADGNNYQLLEPVADITLSQPSLNPTQWKLIRGQLIFETTSGFILAGDVGASIPAGIVIETNGYTTAGDGGGSKWVSNGLSGQTPSQTPNELGKLSLNDASGNQWDLVFSTEVNLLTVGAGATESDYAGIVNGANISTATAINCAGLTLQTTIFSDGETFLNDKFLNGSILMDNSVSTDELRKTNASLSDFEIDRPRTKSPTVAWEGKSLLWVGTSIPAQGNGVDSYPELFAESVGASIENTAFPGSHAGYDVDGDAFSGDTVKALSMTEDDRLAGLALHGPTSAYDDSFNPGNPASEQTTDFRIKATFERSAKDVVFLDHNHNDRRRASGELEPAQLEITSISTGATTDVSLSDASSVDVGDSVTLSVSGITNLNFAAARVQAKGGNTITLNIDSSAYSGSFASGYAQIRDKTTIFGAWQFLISYIRNMSIIYGEGDVRIVLCGAPSQHTGDTTYSNNVWSNAEKIKQVSTFTGDSFFDIGFYYGVKYAEQLDYFPDGTHPSTFETRKALSNQWVQWALGGATPVVNKSEFLPSEGGPYQSAGLAVYNDLSQAFETPDVLYTDSGIILDDDFTDLSGWTTNGIAPTVVAAPWGSGNAVLCTSVDAVNELSFIQSAISGSDDFTAEFDLWMPEVSGLTTNASSIVSLLEVRPGGTAYSVQLLVKQNTIKLRLTYFKQPNVDLVVVGASSNFLQKDTRYKVKLYVIKETATKAGSIALFVDDVREVFAETNDIGQVTPTQVKIGVNSSNTDEDLDLYVGNILINSKLGNDFSSRYTGIALSTQSLIVVNGIITGLI